MSAKSLALAALMLAAPMLAGCAPQASAPAAAPPAPTGKALAAACADRDGWSDPAPPAKLFGNTYYVGTCGITALLIDAPAGPILIDAATAEAAPAILANIRALGFDPKRIRAILTSHEHFDHVGGLAALHAATGAPVIALADAAPQLENGTPDPRDPQRGALDSFTGVPVAQRLRDGQPLAFADIRITAHATPGHTPGSTSWTWQSCEGSACRTIAYVDSLTAISADGYRFSDHPDYVAMLRATFAKVPTLPCDILVTPHPGASNLFARLAGEAPLAGADGCAAYAAAASKRLDDRLAKEAATR